MAQGESLSRPHRLFTRWRVMDREPGTCVICSARDRRVGQRRLPGVRAQAGGRRVTRCAQARSRPRRACAPAARHAPRAQPARTGLVRRRRLCLPGADAATGGSWPSGAAAGDAGTATGSGQCGPGRTGPPASSPFCRPPQDHTPYYTMEFMPNWHARPVRRRRVLALARAAYGRAARRRRALGRASSTATSNRVTLCGVKVVGQACVEDLAGRRRRRRRPEVGSKLSDSGLAKRTDRDVGCRSEGEGTPGFMARSRRPGAGLAADGRVRAGRRSTWR